jgi:hypothetical protein
MQKITMKEYSEKVGLTKNAIYYQIKQKKLNAKKIEGIYYIFLEEEKIKDKPNEEDELIKLKIDLALTKQKIELQEKLLSEKDKTIEAEKRTNTALLHSLEILKIENSNFLTIKPKKTLFQNLLFWRK